MQVTWLGLTPLYLAQSFSCSCWLWLLMPLDPRQNPNPLVPVSATWCPAAEASLQDLPARWPCINCLSSSPLLELTTAPCVLGKGHVPSTGVQRLNLCCALSPDSEPEPEMQQSWRDVRRVPVQLLLAEWSWSKARLPQDVARRNARPGGSGIAHEPMFCFETCAKCLLWAELVYQSDATEVRPVGGGSRWLWLLHLTSAWSI